jgi:hypothetical protein
MHLNHNLYYASNLGRFRDPSPNPILDSDSYYPEIHDIGIHSSESSRLSWDSNQVKVYFSFTHEYDIKLTTQQNQISSSHSGSRLSTTTTSSQESFLALLQANQKLEQEKTILEAKLGALE